MINNIVL